MNCHGFSTVVTDLVRGAADDRTRQAALAHALSCAGCAARLGEERSLSEALHRLAESQGAEQAPEQVETRLLQLFRESPYRSTPVRPAATRSNAALRWAYWATAAAAAAVLALVGFVYSLSRQPAPRRPEVQRAQPRIEPGPALARVPVVKKPHRRPKPAAPVPASDAEIATDFMPLSYASPLEPGETAQVMRVRVPRPTLLSFGLPMNEERAAEPIKADIVVGPDGLARAIRFVRESPVVIRRR